MMPEQKPHRSKQDYATPAEFLRAVDHRFGPIVWDCAAHQLNPVCGKYYFGPGSLYAEDALAIDWRAALAHKSIRTDTPLLWCNPPYSNIEPWAAKCAYEAEENGLRIAFLVPASVGSNWYWRHVALDATVYALHPRLSFDGKAPYPKDLILAVYGNVSAPTELRRWVWKEARRAA